MRRGPFVFVSGTTSIDPKTGEMLHVGSASLQSQQIFGEIIKAVQRLGGKKDDITRVRMFVTSQEDARYVGEVLKDSLGDIGPAATMIIGAKFVSSDMLVEIEADAVVL